MKLDDHERMPSVAIEKAATPFLFSRTTDSAAYTDLHQFLDSNLKNSFTAAFLVIRNDSILYERYFNGFTQASLLPSFSIAKSYVGTLTAIAVDEKYISSPDLPITHFLPELAKRDARFHHITIRHLMDMRSGIEFKEGTYGLKDAAIKLGFRRNIVKHALRLNIEGEPGKKFQYRSVNTELLGLIIQRATGKKLSEYLQEKLWQPLGTEYNATWNVDSRRHKQEIAFAGLNATARDFARLGRLYLHNGEWNQKKLLQPHWINIVSNIDTMHQYGGYKNQWWSKLMYWSFTDSVQAVAFLKSQPYPGNVRKNRNDNSYRAGYRVDAFSAHGLLNQVLYINKKKNLLIVRLGRNWYHPDTYSDQFIYQLGEKL